MNGQIDWVAASTRLYAALVGLYPRPFREAYGPELKLAFRDCVRDGYGRAGVWGVLVVWLGVVPDLLTSAADQHFEEEPGMAMKTITGVLTGTLTGAGLIGGGLWIACGVLLLLGPAGLVGDGLRESGEVIPLFFIGVQLVAFGLIAVFLVASRSWPMPARLLLLVAVGGGLFTDWVWEANAGSADGWMLMAGILVQVAGLALAGAGLLRRSDTRTWGVLLLMLAAGLAFANTEDARAILIAVAGGLMMVLMALILRSTARPHPGRPAASG